jgi:hypothetical protein
MQYKEYPKSKDTPSRKARKSERSKVWVHNDGLAALKRRTKKAAKRAALEAEEGMEE